MTTVVLADAPGRELAKPLKGGVFVLFWIVAIALWIIAPNMVDPRWGAFLIDTGIVFASVGLAATAITWFRPFATTLLAGVIGIALFALGDFLEITALVYFLRMVVPFVAILAVTYASLAKIKVWYN